MRYTFMWKRDRDTRRKEGHGWFSKTIRANSDGEAIEKMLDHVLGRGPVELDYEMSRDDVLYDARNHEATFLNLSKAGVSLLVG